MKRFKGIAGAMMVALGSSVYATEEKSVVVTIQKSHDERLAEHLLLNARKFVSVAQEEGWTEGEIDQALLSSLEILRKAQAHETGHLNVRADLLRQEMATMKIMKIFGVSAAVACVLSAVYLFLATLR